MRYAEYEDYVSRVKSPVEREDFERVLPTACRMIEAETTGVDGVCKLKTSRPLDEDAADAVKDCVCALVGLLLRIEDAVSFSDGARRSAGIENGVISGAVASVSAGKESVSFRDPSSYADAADTAAKDPEKLRSIVSAVAAEHLRGVRDGRGVPLLYAGRYPYEV